MTTEQCSKWMFTGPTTIEQCSKWMFTGPMTIEQCSCVVCMSGAVVHLLFAGVSFPIYRAYIETIRLFRWRIWHIRYENVRPNDVSQAFSGSLGIGCFFKIKYIWCLCFYTRYIIWWLLWWLLLTHFQSAAVHHCLTRVTKAKTRAAVASTCRPLELIGQPENVDAGSRRHRWRCTCKFTVSVDYIILVTTQESVVDDLRMQAQRL